MEIKAELLKFIRRLAFIMLIPMAITTGIHITQRAFNLHDIYVGISIGDNDQ